MHFPEELQYTKEHEWIRVEEDNVAVIGITDFAQGELGDIVYVDVDTVDVELEQNDVFGVVEAVKTTSDLYMPIGGRVMEVNPQLKNSPELVNSDPYGEGWIIKVELSDPSELSSLMDADEYEALVAS
jgi:glycine cleavage system H protein